MPMKPTASKLIHINLIAVALIFAANCASPGVEIGDPYSAAGGNMDEDTENKFSNVGILWATPPADGSNDEEPYEEMCTATLIARNRILTAAHCYGGPRYTYAFETEKNGRERFEIEAIGPHKDWYHNLGVDLAIGTLKGSGVTDPDIIPASLSTTEPTIGQNLTVVGFGETGYEFGDANVRRFGPAAISTVTDSNYDSGVGQPDSAYACRGDSGGPSFNEGGQLTGIHSKGWCSAGKKSVDARVDMAEINNWITTGEPTSEIPGDAVFQVQVDGIYVDVTSSSAKKYDVSFKCGTWPEFSYPKLGRRTMGLGSMLVDDLATDERETVTAQELLNEATCTVTIITSEEEELTLTVPIMFTQAELPFDVATKDIFQTDAAAGVTISFQLKVFAPRQWKLEE